MQSRRVAILSLFAATVLSACNSAPPSPVTTEDVSIGNPNAPVKIIEYGALTCQHCAAFAIETFPTLKAKYIDKGEVYFTYREILGAGGNISAAGYLIARCAGQDKYFDVIDDFFHRQGEILTGGAEAVRDLGRRHGLSRSAVDACLADPEAVNTVRERANRYLFNDGIKSTPTLVINGLRREGEIPVPELERLIAEAKAAAAQAGTPAAP